MVQKIVISKFTKSSKSGTYKLLFLFKIYKNFSSYVDSEFFFKWFFQVFLKNDFFINGIIIFADTYPGIFFTILVLIGSLFCNHALSIWL